MGSDNNQESYQEANQIPQDPSLLLQVDTIICTTQK